MYTESRNIAVYAYLAVKLLVDGKPKEALAHAHGAIWRMWEGIESTVKKPSVTCIYCGWKGPRYKTFVSTEKIRRNAVCPRCHSLERHRAFLSFFRSARSLVAMPIARVLDIAPNRSFSDFAKHSPDLDYLSVDLKSQLAMRHMDIQALDLPDRSFDIVVCYHVLDYVPDDRKAMKELGRVLAHHGIAMIQDGILKSLDHTIEWGKPVPSEAYRIRQYGNDYLQRWQEALKAEMMYEPNLNMLCITHSPELAQGLIGLPGLNFETVQQLPADAEDGSCRK